MMKNFQLRIIRTVSVLVTLIYLAAPQLGHAAKCSAEQGQLLIDSGRYDAAIREFSCVIQTQPTEAEGYRGRAEAELRSGLFSDAARDYAAINAYVLPVHPDAPATILDGYATRLSIAPQNVPALSGASFANWWFFKYPAALQLLNDLLVVAPNDLYGTLFRGSNRMLSNANKVQGAQDLEHAIQIASQNPHVHFIVADAYTYGQPDPARAFAEATIALNGGLDTPRIAAILATSYLAFGDMSAAAAEYEKHIELVTTQLVSAPALAPGSSIVVDLAAGRTFEIPIPAVFGQPISILTDSPTHEISDSIMVLIAQDGTPVFGNDDFKKYFAGLVWNAEETGTYLLRVTSFEGVSTGKLSVTRK
jgi:tetratricopeptide (TPR) repeat protein